MPGFNKKGPHGEGPMTGRQMGHCTKNGQGPKTPKPDTEKDNSQPDDTNSQAGKGMGRRLGRRGGGGRGKGR